MSEPLYNRSKAVAALNRIDGFEPMEFARVIEKEGKEPQLYLDVKFRKLWFRLCNPNGKISKKIISLNENMAIVEAKVYLDKEDQPDSYVACALSQKFRTDDPKFGDKFLETAETAATGRALADAGYGIQFIEGEENDSNLEMKNVIQIRWILVSQFPRALLILKTRMVLKVHRTRIIFQTLDISQHHSLCIELLLQMGEPHIPRGGRQENRHRRLWT